MESNYCLECQKKVYGRMDKKYCNNHCRNAFHFKKNRNTQLIVRQVNRILQKNRCILNNFIQSEQRIINYSSLILKGYNFQYETQRVFSPTDGEILYCYEFGLKRLNDKHFQLIQNPIFENRVIQHL